ncbi:MAG: GlcG/HbpS family heme-binding protein, partial [Gemmatimonadales bacterium]
AHTAARFRRPTKAIAEALAGGRMGFLGVEGVVPLEGGLPLVANGAVVGAIGVSGMTGEQDAAAARAGVAALKP